MLLGYFVCDNYTGKMLRSPVVGRVYGLSKNSLSSEVTSEGPRCRVTEVVVWLGDQDDGPNTIFTLTEDYTRIVPKV